MKITRIALIVNVVITLIVNMVLIVLIHNAEGADFRDVSWGMTLEEVKSIEKSKLTMISEPDENGSQAMMYYFGETSNLYYFFKNDKLTNVSCVCLLENNTQATVYYEKYKEILTKKHGTMTSEVIEYGGNIAIWKTKYRIIQLIVSENGPEQMIGMMLNDKK